MGQEGEQREELPMTGFAKRAAVEPRLLAPEVTAVGASQGVKY